MLNDLIKVLCELAANVEALVKNLQKTEGNQPNQARISSSISPVMKHGQQPVRPRTQPRH